MNVKLLLAASASAVLGAGWFAGSGAATGYALSTASASAQVAAVAQQPELDTWSGNPSLGVSAPTEVVLRVPAAAAEVGKVTLYVPGYSLNLAAQPGTLEGRAFMVTASDFADGDLRAVNPAAYINTPQAQACAPGPHSAVWIMDFQDGFFSSEAATVPIYIDPTTADEAALGTYKLQACLPLASLGSPGGWAIGSKLRGLDLEFTRLTNPASAGLYVWRAFVSNPDLNGNPDPSTTYELRSDMPLPARLTLTSRFVGKHHRALLSGQLTTPASPVAGIPISLYRRGAYGFWIQVASTRTLSDGSYRFIRRIAKTGTYAVEIWGIGACNGDSTAPNSCINETRAALDSRSVRVVVHKRR